MAGKKIWALTAALALSICGILGGFSAPALAAFEGAGTAEEPYMIRTEEELSEVRDHADKHFKLANDITLTGEWTPISSEFGEFTGTFDGGGFEISGLYCSGGGGYSSGLFRFIHGTVKNLGVVIKDEGSGSAPQNGVTGGLASLAGGSAVITNCYVKGKISGGPGTGGLIGKNFGSISYCHADAAVSGTSVVGGLVGSNHGTISYCCANSVVTGDSYIGGLVGSSSVNYSPVPPSVSYSYANSEVSAADRYAGGLIGNNSDGCMIAHCYAVGIVEGPTSGGLVGYLYGGVAGGSYAACSVNTGDGPKGGLVGAKEGIRGDVLNSYYDSEISDCSDADSGTPLSTQEMKQPTSLADFNFNTVWAIDPSVNGGYPYLQALKPGMADADPESPQQEDSIEAEPSSADAEPKLQPQPEDNIIAKPEPAPSVIYVSGFENYIEIAFDKYMDTATLVMDSSAQTGFAPPGGYDIVWVGAEDDPDDPSRPFVKTIRVVPKGKTFPEGETMTVTVSVGAKSRAGVAMESPYSGEIKIEAAAE
ncbi:MAG: hypothetical protein FWG09_06305 [Synergistaceae bacterium]|nr:hypothetical protein [Synergistaceae bacterium]